MIIGPRRFGGLMMQDLSQMCNSLTKQWILCIQVKIFVSTHLILEDFMKISMTVTYPYYATRKTFFYKIMAIKLDSVEQIRIYYSNRQ